MTRVCCVFVMLAFVGACDGGSSGGGGGGGGGPAATCGDGFDCVSFGTDTFGYQGFKATTSPPPCDDISATGTATGLIDDSHVADIPIGFSFDFYGTAHTTATLGSNGHVYFAPEYLGLGNVCMPGTPTYTLSSYEIIAALWDDLYPEGADAYVKYQTLGAAPYRRFVVEHSTRVCCTPTSALGRFRIVLFETTNDIRVCYEDTAFDASGGGASAGIQGSATEGLGFSCNTADLTSGLVLEYQHP